MWLTLRFCSTACPLLVLWQYFQDLTVWAWRTQIGRVPESCTSFLHLSAYPSITSTSYICTSHAWSSNVSFLCPGAFINTAGTHVALNTALRYGQDLGTRLLDLRLLCPPCQQVDQASIQACLTCRSNFCQYSTSSGRPALPAMNARSGCMQMRHSIPTALHKQSEFFH